MNKIKLLKRGISLILSLVLPLQIEIAAVPQSVFAMSVVNSYAVYSQKDVLINAQNAAINGNVYNGEIFNNLGDNICYVNSSLNSGKIKGKVKSLTTDDGRTEMPDYVEELKNIEYQTVYSENKAVLYQPEYNISGSIYAENDLWIDRTVFSSKGYINAAGNIQYDAVTNNDDCSVFLYSQKGNVTVQGSHLSLKGVIYAPNGTVEINAKNLDFDGSIIAENIEINGTDINISSLDEYDIDLITFKHDIYITEDERAAGIYKENRKIVLDIPDNTAISDIDKSTVSWNITAADPNNNSSILFDESTSNNYHKELIISKAGEYSAVLSGKDSKGNNIEYKKEIHVKEDLPPVSSFSVKEKQVLRNSEKTASISINDTSFSPDGDTIVSRIWSVYYDSNNDGSFDDEKKEIISDKNEKELVYNTDRVGKYKFVLDTAESFTDTIPSLISDDAFRNSTTENDNKTMSIVEVTNKAPETSLELSLAKNVDIVVTSDNNNMSDIKELSGQVKELKSKLENAGYSVNISEYSNSTMNAKDTISWDRYDHYNYEDEFPKLNLERHIFIENNSVKMIGYGVEPNRDWLFYDDGNSEKRVFTFDLMRDKTNWHTMEGGGFLFNTSIYEDTVESEDENESPKKAKFIDGYALLLGNDHFILVRINKAELEMFRNGTDPLKSITSFGPILQRVNLQKNNSFLKHNIKIVTDSRMISVYDNDKIIIENFVLPDRDTGTGFGPITCHGHHGCEQQSYFTFSNIHMTTLKGYTLDEAVKNYEWRDSAQKFVINVSENGLYDYSDDKSLAEAVKIFTEKGIKLIGLGSDKSEQQFQRLLKSISGNYFDWDLEKINHDTLINYVLSEINSIDYSIKNNYITTSDELAYNNIYSDMENDPFCDVKWKYEVDSSVFENSKGKNENFEFDTPVTNLDTTGKYSVSYLAKDDPTEENADFDEYKKWSEIKKMTDVLYVHSKPEASVSSETNCTEDHKNYYSSLSFDSYDIDFQSHENKGISKEIKEWKCLDDSSWNEGTVPRNILPETVYLQKYTVCDEQGCLSDSAVEIVFAEKENDDFILNDKTPPSVDLTISDLNPSVGDEIIISASADDESGIKSFSVLIGGYVITNYQGSFIYQLNNEKDLKIEVKCTDYADNPGYAEETVHVTDRRDLVYPEFKNISASFEEGKCVISGSVTDNVKIKKYTVSYAPAGSSDFITVFESSDSVVNGKIAAFDIKEGTGNYVSKIVAEDTSGNARFININFELKEDNIKTLSTVQNNERAKIKENIDHPAEITIKPSADVAEVGDTVYVTVDASDADGIRTMRVYKNNRIVLNGPGEITFREDKAETVEILVEVFDLKNRKTEKTSVITIEDHRDHNPPTAEITVPVNEEVVHGKIQIKGSAYDDISLRKYSLEYIEYSTGISNEISASKNEIRDGILGELDTYFLNDGKYALKLTVTDRAGNSNTALADVVIKNVEETDTEELYSDFVIVNKPEPGVVADKVLPLEVTLDHHDYTLFKPAGYSYDIIKEGSSQSVISCSDYLYNSSDVDLDIDTSLLEDGKYYIDFCVNTTSKDIIKKEIPFEVSHGKKTIDTDCTCKIISPSDLESVKTFCEVICEVSNDIFDKYKFEYSRSGENDFILIDSGNIDLDTKISAYFNAANVENGFYDIRCTVYNDNYFTSDQITVKAEGNFKIGNFSISYDDITFNVNQSPVTLTRTYNSINKNRDGVFGYGWDLSWNNINISSSTKENTNWKEVRTTSRYLSTFKIEETKKHEITVNLGNGVSETFVARLNNNISTSSSLYDNLSISYVPLKRSRSTLEPVNIKNYDLYFINNTLLTPDFSEFEPSCYLYTRPDGVKYLIDEKEGLKEITASSGEKITFSHTGIKHSSGQSISLKYNENGKIIEASSKNCPSVYYKYNRCGDLETVTTRYDDSTEEIVTFVYSAHFITGIVDSQGRYTLKNEFDEDGRLVKSYDINGNETKYVHDIEEKTESVTDKNGLITKYVYDENGNVLSQTDPNGNVTSFKYDENDNVIFKKDPMGNELYLTYDEYNNVTSYSDGKGNTVQNGYDESGFISSVQQSDRIVFSASYNDKGYISECTDHSGEVLNFEYDKHNRITSLKNEDGKGYTFAYDDSGLVTHTTDQTGAEYEMTYDEFGNCTSKTKTTHYYDITRSGTEYYTYDLYGNKIQTIDEDGNTVSSYKYDNLGRLLSKEESGDKEIYYYTNDGKLSGIRSSYHYENYTYDKEGHILTVRSSEEPLIRYTYDGNYNVLSKEYSDETSETFTYNKNNQMTSKTDREGNVTKFEYDSLGRNSAVIDHYGHRTEYTYTFDMRISSKKDSKGNVFKYFYDPHGNISKTIYPDGSTYESEYGKQGELLKTIDQNGYTTSYTYDDYGNITSVTDAFGNKTLYEYNSIGKISKITDANGNSTTYEYDKSGREIKRTNASGKSSEKTYDDQGNVLTSTDFGGNLTSYSYTDSVLTNKTNKDYNIRYYYNSAGKSTGVAYNSSYISFTYDKYNNPVRVISADGRTVEYTYDDNGNVTSVISQSGTVYYEYDKLGRMMKVTDKNGNVTQYEYDFNSNRTATKYSNGIIVSYEYDELNRLTGETTTNSKGDVISKYLYTLGAAGERIKIEELDRTVEYKYDKLYRLIGETITDSYGKVTKYEYEYDKVGNRISKTENGKKTIYTYNELNQLIKDDKSTYEYDDAGNLISVVSDNESVLYMYNADNKPVTITRQYNGITVSENYVYDAYGNRIAKYSDDEYTGYLNDLTGTYTQVLSEYDKEGNETCSYTRGTELISMEKSGKVTDYLTDGHGSVRQLCDENEKITDSYVYDAWGNLIDSSGTTNNSYMYCCEQNDSFAGLYYLRARYMNPSTGVFTSSDTYEGSLSDPISLHKYLYANDDPVMNIDPSGNFSMIGFLAGPLGNSCNCQAALRDLATIKSIATYAILGLFSGLAEGIASGDKLTNALKGIANGLGTWCVLTLYVALISYFNIAVLLMAILAAFDVASIGYQIYCIKIHGDKKEGLSELLLSIVLLITIALASEVGCLIDVSPLFSFIDAEISTLTEPVNELTILPDDNDVNVHDIPDSGIPDYVPPNNNPSGPDNKQNSPSDNSDNNSENDQNPSDGNDNSEDDQNHSDESDDNSEDGQNHSDEKDDNSEDGQNHSDESDDNSEDGQNHSDEKDDNSEDDQNHSDEKDDNSEDDQNHSDESDDNSEDDQNSSGDSDNKNSDDQNDSEIIVLDDKIKIYLNISNYYPVVGDQIFISVTTDENIEFKQLIIKIDDEVAFTDQIYCIYNCEAPKAVKISVECIDISGRTGYDEKIIEII